MGFFGRLSFLIDENAHAVHFFVSALLQMLDRCVPFAAPGVRMQIHDLHYCMRKSSKALLAVPVANALLSSSACQIPCQDV